MRISILTKLIILLISLSVLPIGLLGFISINDFEQLEKKSKDYIEKTGDVAIHDSEISMKKLGEQIIYNKAISTAKQLEIYILANPEMTVADLQADPYFSSLAVQSVGKTGYTAVSEEGTQICRFHISDSLKNLDLHFYEDKLPDLWSILENSKGRHESSGYYDWIEEDGTLKQKYMYVKALDVPTADGVYLYIQATTYIEEFSEPIEKIRKNVNNSVDLIIGELKDKTSGILIRNFIAISLIIVIISIIGSLFAYSIVKPIKEFSYIADKVSQGDLANTDIQHRSADEIGELGESLKRLITSMKYYMDKSKRV